MCPRELTTEVGNRRRMRLPGSTAAVSNAAFAATALLNASTTVVFIANLPDSPRLNMFGKPAQRQGASLPRISSVVPLASAMKKRTFRETESKQECMNPTEPSQSQLAVPISPKPLWQDLPESVANDDKWILLISKRFSQELFRQSGFA
jgi:hypothetical protein